LLQSKSAKVSTKEEVAFLRSVITQVWTWGRGGGILVLELARGKARHQQPPLEDMSCLSFSPMSAGFAGSWQVRPYALLSGRTVVCPISGDLPFLQQAQELF